MFPRILAAVLGLLLAALLGTWLVTQRLPPPPPMQIVDGRAALQELTDWIGAAEVAGAGSRRGPGGHFLLNEQITEFVFNVKSQRMQYDPLAYFRRPAFQYRMTRWPEHPAGRWTVRTNGLGLREDEELSRERPELGIFVTGDSHTDGVCENSESYPHVLESLLAAARPDRSVQVYNAGVGGYSFYNYLGAFDRFQEFDMQAYVVGVYGGNDYYGVLTPYRFFHGLDIPAPLRDPVRGSRALEIEINKPALSQGFFAYTHFAERPEDEQLAVDAAIETTLALAARCSERGVRLIIAYIPPLYDVSPELLGDQLDQLIEAFELDDHEMAVTDRQTDAYLAALRAADVEVLDLRPAFRAAKEPLYWLRDHHINLAAQRLIAENLAPLFE